MPATLVSPPPADLSAVGRAVQAARRRLGTQRIFEWVVQTAHVALLALILAAGARLLFGRSPAPAFWELALVGGLALGFVGQRVWTRWPGPVEAARALDSRAGTRDRFLTGLTLARRTNLSPVETLAAEECACFAARFEVRRWTPLVFPRAARWLVVPALTWSLLLWRGALPSDDFLPDPNLQAALRSQADELQRAADTITGKKDAADRRLAEELARAAERLRQAAALRNPDPEAARREALRALADLKDHLRRLADARPSPAEIAALAAALEREGSETARAAASALKRGEREEASRQLEKLLAELKKNADPAAALERLTRAMQDQAGKLSANERGELSRQMAQAQTEASQREGLLKKIAELLRQRGSNGETGPSGANQGGQGPGENGAPPGPGGAGSSTRGLSNQQLQSLLDSLENMKNGLNGNGTAGQGGTLLSLENSPGRGVQGPSADGNQGNLPPGGAPGSARDPGSSDLGTRPDTGGLAPPERAARITGQLGEGETLSDLAPSTDPGAPARPGRRYREIYETMAPAARESVRQENIPLGSRVLVERYFQNIRPPE